MGILRGKKEKKLLLLVAFAIALYLVFKYIFPLVAPFIFAFLIVYLSYPWLKKLQKKTHIRRDILLAGILFFTVVLLLLGVWGLISWGTVHAADIGDGVAYMQEKMDGALHDGCIFLERNFGVDAAEAETEILERMSRLSEDMKNDSLTEAAKQSWEYVKGLIGVGAFLGVSFIASMLLCRDYESVVENLGENPALDAVWQFVEKTAALVGSYLKAQAVILFTISVIAVAGLLIGRVKWALALGILAGLLDALPFIGTGIVLMPAALWQLLDGNVVGAVTAVIVYMICMGAREFLEPRLLGKQVGIYPVVMLLAVYAGVGVFGLGGIFLGPLYAVLFREGSAKIRETVDGWEAEK